MKLEFYLSNDPYYGGISLYMRDMANINPAVATNVEFKTLTDEMRGKEGAPLLKLDRQAAQSLMDQLWNCGVRPAEGHGSAGQLGATERHLKDMRRIVFAQAGHDHE